MVGFSVGVNGDVAGRVDVGAGVLAPQAELSKVNRRIEPMRMFDLFIYSPFY